MGLLLRNIIRQCREARGSFFVARVTMRLRFDPSQPAVSDSSENVQAVIDVCRELGYEVPAQSAAVAPGLAKE